MTKIRTALVRTKNGNLKVMRYDDYKTQKEMANELRANGLKVVKIWNEDKSMYDGDVLEHLNRNDYTKLTDGRKTLRIAMRYWNSDDHCWTIDWSNDFFAVVGLTWDKKTNAYIVDDVERCLEQALDWERCQGDYYGEDEDDALIKRGWERNVVSLVCTLRRLTIVDGVEFWSEIKQRRSEQ